MFSLYHSLFALLILALLINPSASALYESVGCINDSTVPTNADVIKPANLIANPSGSAWTVQRCIDAVSVAGKVYAGLTGGQCYGTNLLLVSSSVTNITSACSVKCSDNLPCGGGVGYEYYASVYYLTESTNTYIVGPDDSIRADSVHFNVGFTVLNGEDDDFAVTNGYVVDLTIGFCEGLDTKPMISFIVVDQNPTTANSFRFVGKSQQIVNVPSIKGHVNVTLNNPVYIKKGQKLGLYFQGGIGADICRTLPNATSRYFWRSGEFTATSFTSFSSATGFQVAYKYRVNTRPMSPILNGLNVTDVATFDKVSALEFKLIAPLSVDTVLLKPLTQDGFGAVTINPPLSVFNLPPGTTTISLNVQAGDRLLSRTYSATIIKPPALSSLQITDDINGMILFGSGHFVYSQTNYTDYAIWANEYCSFIRIVATDRDGPKTGSLIQMIRGPGPDYFPIPSEGLVTPLGWGDNQVVSIQIKNVTSGLFTNYHIIFARPYNADLSDLNTKPQSLIFFHRYINYYSLDVSYTQNNFVLSAIPVDPNAKVTVQVGDSAAIALPTAVDSSPLPLAVGYTQIHVNVRSTDDVVKQTYTLDIHRLPSPDSLISFVRITDTVNTLDRLFAPSTYYYDLVLDSSFRFTLDAQSQNPNSIIKITDQNFTTLVADSTGWATYKYSYTKDTYLQGPVILKIVCTAANAPNDQTIYTIALIVVAPTIPPTTTRPYTTTTTRAPATTRWPTPPIPAFQNLGCIVDVAHNPNITFADIVTPENLVFLNTTIRPSWSVQSCLTAANALGRVYAGLTNSGSNCYATNKLLLPGASTKQGDANCNTQCTDGNICGGNGEGSLFVSVYWNPRATSTYQVGPSDDIRDNIQDYNEGFTVINGDAEDLSQTNGFITQATVSFCIGSQTSPTMSFMVLDVQPGTPNSFKLVSKVTKTIYINQVISNVVVSFADAPMYIKKGQRFGIYIPNTVGADACATISNRGSKYYWKSGEYDSTDYQSWNSGSIKKIAYRYTVSTKPNGATLIGFASTEVTSDGTTNVVRFTQRSATSFSYIAPVWASVVNLTALTTDPTSIVTSTPFPYNQLPIITNPVSLTVVVRGADNLLPPNTYTLTITRPPALSQIVIKDGITGAQVFPDADNEFSYGVTNYNTAAITSAYCDRLTVTVVDKDGSTTNTFQVIKASRSYALTDSVPLQVAPEQLVIVRVTSPATGLSTNYNILITRPYTARLVSINTNPANLIAFSRDNQTYSVEVPYTQSSFTVTVVPYDPLVTMGVYINNGQSFPIYPGVVSPSLPLTMGNNKVVIHILATEFTPVDDYLEYTIDVNRLPSPSSKLSNITIFDTDRAIEPAFSSGIYSYTIVLSDSYSFSFHAIALFPNSMIYLSNQDGLNIDQKVGSIVYRFRYNAQSIAKAPRIIRITVSAADHNVDETVYRILIVAPVAAPPTTTPAPQPGSPAVPVVIGVADAASANGTIPDYTVGLNLAADIRNALNIDTSRLTYQGVESRKEESIYFNFVFNPPVPPATAPDTETLYLQLKSQIGSSVSLLRLAPTAGKFVIGAVYSKYCSNGAVIPYDETCPPAVESSKSFPVAYQVVIAVLVAAVCIALFIIAYCVYRKRQDGMEALKRVGGFHNAGTSEFVDEGKGRRSSFSNINTNDHSVVIPDHEHEEQPIEVELHGQKSTLVDGQQDSDE